MGAALWTATNWRFSGSVIGASPGVAGLLVLYGCIQPNNRVTLLLLFVPVTFVVKYLVFTVLGAELLGWFFFDVMGKTSVLGWEHSAHLGGMTAGWLYFRLVYSREWKTLDGRAEMELPKWFKRAKTTATVPPAFKLNLSSREDVKAEVDRILDKINSDGFNALTPEEHRVLDGARDVMSKP